MSHSHPQADLRASLDALAAAVQAAEAGGSEDEVTAALAVFRESAQRINLANFRDTPLLPADAGEHSRGLMRILARIPEGWGRWIGCGPGWYPLIIELDEQIASLWLGYEVQQVKEKYGSLRYYVDLGRPSFDYLYPRPRLADYEDEEALATAVAEWQAAWEAWRESEEGRRELKVLAEANEQLWPKVEALIDAAEARSSQICEQCGQPGQLRKDGGWWSTRCDACRD